MPAGPFSVDKQLDEVFLFIHVRVHAEGINDLE